MNNTKKMKWETLLCDTRFGLEERHGERLVRTDFQRDYDRLVFSAPFRRLQNKTQIFPLPGKVFVHNRLTHSLEVSCVGRSLGNNVGYLLRQREPQSPTGYEDIGSIVSAACLAHDMGNPPFGHSGERAITAFFTEGEGVKYKEQVEKEGGRWSDFEHFEGNANALRLLTHQFEGRRKGGFALTYSTLASIVKYPYGSHQSRAKKKKKFGFFQTEEETYEKIASLLGIPIIEQDPLGGAPIYARYPLVYLVEAADDICYQIMDIEDAFKLKLLDKQETESILMGFLDAEKKDKVERDKRSISDRNEQIAYLRSLAIGALVDECTDIFYENEELILQGGFEGALVDHLSSPRLEAFRRCAKVAAEQIYLSKEVRDIELAGFTIFSDLLERLIVAQKEPQRAYSKLWFGRVPSQYKLTRPTLYGKIQTALDYMSGMTDIYAVDLYKKLTGMSLPSI